MAPLPCPACAVCSHRCALPTRARVHLRHRRRLRHNHLRPRQQAQLQRRPECHHQVHLHRRLHRNQACNTTAGRTLLSTSNVRRRLLGVICLKCARARMDTPAIIAQTHQLRRLHHLLHHHLSTLKTVHQTALSTLSFTRHHLRHHHHHRQLGVADLGEAATLDVSLPTPRFFGTVYVSLFKI